MFLDNKHTKGFAILRRDTLFCQAKHIKLNAIRQKVDIL